MILATHTFDLIDDDGVFIVSTRKNVIAACPAQFDYDFPGVLVPAHRSGLLVPWRSPMESISEVTARRHDRSASTARGSRAGFLRVPDDDDLVALTWSSLTMAYDGNGGDLTSEADLIASFPIPAGWYEVLVGPPLHLDDGPRDTSLRWTVDIVLLDAPPSRAALDALELLTFDEPRRE